MSSEEKKYTSVLEQLNSSKTNEEFFVPENYFDSLAERIESRINAPEADEAFFAQQEENIFFRIKTENLKDSREFITPENYFEDNEEQLLTAIKHKEKKETKVFSLKIIAASLSAACVTVAAFFFFQSSNTDNPVANSFEKALAEASLSKGEYLSTLNSEELTVAYLDEITSVNNSNVGTPSGETNSDDLTTNEEEIFREILPEDIKPFEEDYALILEDITAEEILNYLMDEGYDLEIDY